MLAEDPWPCTPMTLRYTWLPPILCCLLVPSFVANASSAGLVDQLPFSALYLLWIFGSWARSGDKGVDSVCSKTLASYLSFLFSASFAIKREWSRASWLTHQTVLETLGPKPGSWKLTSSAQLLIHSMPLKRKGIVTIGGRKVSQGGYIGKRKKKGEPQSSFEMLTWCVC